MIVKQIYTGCLAQGAYYIESNGEVAIIDPLREVDEYIITAKNNNANIKYIFETHFHADFVSGHVTLAQRTGAKIIYGPNANTNFDCVVAKDQQVFTLGNLQIKVLHTPGHTMESSTFLLIDENGKEHAIFTGDTLFLGDVGRPDLAQKSNLTQEDLAGILFDSLRNKIMTLPKEIIIYPGHGAGSSCGKNMSKETIGTLKEQLNNNYALRQNMSKSEFVKEITNGLETPPDYFPLNVKLNKEGYQNVDKVILNGKQRIEAINLEKVLNLTGAIILDTRHQDDFTKEHIPRSIFIGIDGKFAPWVGCLIKNTKQPIILVAEENRVEEVITRLARVGFDQVVGVVNGGVNAWKNAAFKTDSISQKTAQELEVIIKNKNPTVFDVRKKSEYQTQHIIDVKLTPLTHLNQYFDEFKNKKETYLHCGGGYRSVIAISILKNRGIHNITDIIGGFSAIKKTNINTTAYVCPSTL